MKKAFLLFFFASQYLLAQTPCIGGFASTYPCNKLDLLSNLPISSMGGSGIGNDSWGWTDPDNGDEYAIIGMSNGTAFVDISDPINPVYLGILPTHTNNSSWRDIKTYNNHAFIISEASIHGMQVFDLTRLRNVASPPETFTEDAHLDTIGAGDTHNIAINEETGYAYIIGGRGSGGYSGGPIFINIQDPINPVVEGGFSSDGYTHDAQIVIYHGSDTEHVGKEILFASNEDTVTIIDVTDKSAPVQISSTAYSNSSYTHQGWLTYDHDYYIFNDELDEQSFGFSTRTRIMDFTDLDNPSLVGSYNGATNSIDHNGYTKGNRYYMANYRAGMRVLDITNVSTASLTEVAYFDTYPSSNSAEFNGAWNVYPYFNSGVMVISDIERGLFLVKDPNYDATPPTVVCQNITITLDASGTATITALQVDGGSTDNGLIFDRVIDKSTFTCVDIGPNNVELTVLDSNENKSTCTAVVTVEATTSTFVSGTWDIAPDAGAKALFQDSFDTDTFGDVTACSCEIETGKTVTVNSGGFLDITGDILVDGNLIVEDEGSIVQRDASAVTTNNGTIRVTKTTTNLNDVDFTILGSPMTGETREGVYENSALVRHHITENFVPNQDVEDEYPLADNFADDNGDNWQTHTGNLIVGEGYLVRPFPLGETGGTYTTDYTQGTLNNGLINFTTIFGNDQNDSPNILSNPYASSLDAFVFVTDNPIVDAIYYWEHITAPNISYPGYSPTNYNMGDISMYNLSGGMSAPNEQAGDPIDKPSNQFIPSGQGFGIKANAAGTVTFDNTMRLTTNNDGYRISETAIERLYLSVSNNTYGLKSGTLIAFTEFATDGFDRNYDAKRLATPISLFSLNNDRELGIQGRSTFNDEHFIPLGFSTQVEENQEYTISIGSIEGEQLSQATVYLKDKFLNAITNLSETNYSFISDEGQQTNRFELIFKDEVLGASDILQNIYLYPNPAQSKINIYTSDNILTQVKIYDIRGRQVKVSSLMNQGNYQIDISKLDAAFYFVEINTNTGTVVKRILKK